MSVCHLSAQLFFFQLKSVIFSANDRLGFNYPANKRGEVRLCFEFGKDFFQLLVGCQQL